MRLGSSSQRIMGQTIEELSYSKTDLHESRLFANFSLNYAKIQNSFEQNKFISCLNCSTFSRGSG